MAFALVLTLLCPGAVAQRSRGPFSEDEVVQALQGDVPPKRIAMLARQYGISFQLTPGSEGRLRKAGATEELLDALRSLAPPIVAGPLLIKSNSPGAQVFLDGRPVGMTDDKGELQLAQLPPGQHKLRLALAGYEDYEQTTSLLAGQPVSVPVTLVTLKKYAPPAVLGAGQQAASPTRRFRVSHQHMIGSCRGLLTIGNGRIQYQADKGRDSFDVPLKEVTYGQVTIGGGFYLRLNGGKDWDFHSDSTLDILVLLQQASGAGSRPTLLGNRNTVP